MKGALMAVVLPRGEDTQASTCQHQCEGPRVYPSHIDQCDTDAPRQSRELTTRSTTSVKVQGWDDEQDVDEVF